MTKWLRPILVCAVALFGANVRAHAQAPINSNVALQPSKGGLIIRQQFRYTGGGQRTLAGDLDVELASSITTFVYGVSSELALILDVPFVLSRRLEIGTTGADTDSGFADLRLLSKLRLYRDDFGPTGTTRFDLLAGLELPTGRDRFSSDSVDPILGGVFTHIDGRHGFNADAFWQFNTGGGDRSDDLLRYDLAYLFRLSPVTYAARPPDTHSAAPDAAQAGAGLAPPPTAIFVSVELNGFYETNGDHELFVSPGIQYVTTRWIVEATVQLPVLQDLDDRVERDFIVGVGFRVQF